jgi:hypothetical protein
MRTPTLAILAALAAGLPLFADETPEATSAACTFTLDSMGSPRALKTAADITALRPATYQPVETVTLVAPDGTVSTVISGASGTGTIALPITAVGGVWTARSTRSGTATFTVRHSLDDTLGAGTAASPAILVDGDELVDYNAGNGYVFEADAWNGLFDALTLPSGVRLEELDGGAWCLVSSPDGCEYAWAGASVYPVDSRLSGPDRVTKRRDALPVAYTGDNWIGDASKASTLTFVSPEGETATLNLAGTGAQPFTLKKTGDWTVQLTMADGSTRDATLTVIGEAFILTVR